MDVVVRQPTRRAYRNEKPTSAGRSRSGALVDKYGDRGPEVSERETRQAYELWIAKRRKRIGETE